MTINGFSAQRLTRVRGLLDRQVDLGFVPGVLAVLARHGEVHIEATGTLAFDGARSGTPMANDTICRMGSMTKPIVAACATLTVPIADALDVLGPPSSDEWIRRLGMLPLVHQPGERWMYDTAANVTGVLIARATGMSFGAALSERICGPLGMKDTAFSVRRESIARLATAYERANSAAGEPVIEDPLDGRWSRPPAFESGGGGLVSTADDYLAFASALLAGGIHRDDRVLSRPSVTLMTSDHLTTAQKAVSGVWPGYFDTLGWGFPRSVRARRTHLGPSVGSYGWPGFYGTAWYNDPAEDLTAIFMMQRAHAGDQTLPMWLDLWTAVYQAIDD